MVETENENAHTNIRTDSQELCHEYADFRKKGYAREKSEMQTVARTLRCILRFG